VKQEHFEAEEQAVLATETQTEFVGRKAQMALKFQEMSERLNRTPNSSEWQNYSGFSLGQVQRAFGSWGSFVSDMGGVATRAVEHRKVTEEELVVDYERLKEELGHPPSSLEINRWGKFSSSSYALVFGSISEFREKMGDEANDGRSGLSMELVEKAYRVLESELERPPVSFELADKLGVCRRTLLRHVGSYKDLVRKLSDGQPLPRRRHRSPRGRIKDQELITEYRRLEKSLGHTPSFDEMNEHGKYSPTLYVVRFGSWSGFVQEMGGTQRVHRLEIDLGMAEKTYHQLCDGLGRRPTLLEVCDKLGISVRGFYNHFGLYKDFRRKMTDEIVG